MGYTNPRYPVFEIALSCEYGGTHTGGLMERKVHGDIIAMRPPSTAVGSGEMSRFLWLRIEGLEENEMAKLADLLVVNEQIFDKRRYCIPLDRLKAVVPSFDIARAKDSADKYQPFLGVDEETPFRFVRDHRPLNVHGLVYDKLKSRFI